VVRNASESRLGFPPEITGKSSVEIPDKKLNFRVADNPPRTSLSLRTNTFCESRAATNAYGILVSDNLLSKLASYVFSVTQLGLNLVGPSFVPAETDIIACNVPLFRMRFMLAPSRLGTRVKTDA
jgi:hypothetical protein